jgi:prophage tail gpP-like protein
MADDPVTLLINGMIYGGWTEITIERGIYRPATAPGRCQSRTCC